MGYGIDNVTLLALTLAVGLVVDDAIVMLEAIIRHIEEGMAPFEAALRGRARSASRSSPSPSRSRAVFLPILLMGGVVGRVFNAFAATVCARGGGVLLRLPDPDAADGLLAAGPLGTRAGWTPSWSGASRPSSAAMPGG